VILPIGFFLLRCAEKAVVARQKTPLVFGKC